MAMVTPRDREVRLQYFDFATERQNQRDSDLREHAGDLFTRFDRGWRREDLYDR